MLSDREVVSIVFTVVNRMHSGARQSEQTPWIGLFSLLAIISNVLQDLKRALYQMHQSR